jgi:hypothetical protein
MSARGYKKRLLFLCDAFPLCLCVNCIWMEIVTSAVRKKQKNRKMLNVEPKKYGLLNALK